MKEGLSNQSFEFTKPEYSSPFFYHEIDAFSVRKRAREQFSLRGHDNKIFINEHDSSLGIIDQLNIACYSYDLKNKSYFLNIPLLLPAKYTNSFIAKENNELTLAGKNIIQEIKLVFNGRYKFNNSYSELYEVNETNGYNISAITFPNRNSKSLYRKLDEEIFIIEESQALDNLLYRNINDTLIIAEIYATELYKQYSITNSKKRIEIK